MEPRYQYSNSISINDQSGDHHPFHSWRMIPCFNSPNIPPILGFSLGSVNILSRDTFSSGSPRKCRLSPRLATAYYCVWKNNPRFHSLLGATVWYILSVPGMEWMEGMEGIGWRSSSQLCDAESMQSLSCGGHFDDVYEQWLHFTSRLNPVFVILE